MQLLSLREYEEYIKNNNTRLTVFIVTYNRCRDLHKSIKSVLNQSYSNFILLILDNNSTDETKEVISSFNDSRIYFYRHDENIGGIGNINFAFSIVATDFFVVFHDDDIMCEKFLEIEIVRMIQNEYDFVSSKAKLINQDGKAIEKKQKKAEKLYFSGSEYFEYILKKGESVIFPSLMYRSSFIKQNNLKLNIHAGPCADFYLVSEICMNGGKLCVIDEALIIRQIHENQDSNRSAFWMNIQVLNFFVNDDKYFQICQKNQREIFYGYINNILHLLANYHENKVEIGKVREVLVGITFSLQYSFLENIILKTLVFCSLRYTQKLSQLLFLIRLGLRKLKSFGSNIFHG